MSFSTPTEPVRLTPGFIKSYLRSRGIREDVLVHEQDYRQFLRERGLKELGRGGEGAVYFLRGHVVKMVAPELAGAALREVAHMLHLNHTSERGAAMGERLRDDWPALLWVYTLSNGSVAIGMRPFDAKSDSKPGSTLYDRLAAGPAVERPQVLRAIRLIGHSLVYAQRRGIIHYDLKPANIYIPSDPAQAPVVFDLGQALWRNTPWGSDWLRHAHNYSHWYNGTYRYMHYMRRLAHLAALAIAAHTRPTAKQADAFKQFVPSYYDDVFAFAYIIRDILRSPQMTLTAADKTALTVFYRAIMGFKEKHARGLAGPPLVQRMMQLFTGKRAAAEALPPLRRCDSMELLMPRLETLLESLG